MSGAAIVPDAGSRRCGPSGRRGALRGLGIATALSALLAVAAPVVGQTNPPTLRIDAPASLAAVAERVDRFPDDRLTTAMILAGLRDAGSPIDVLLIAERSDLARSTPEWISGFADARRNLVVLFPNRAMSYPTDSLETLLHHEVAHVLFARAAQGQPFPRWFNEGLAMAAERPVGLGDRSRLAWVLVRHGMVSLAELERLFGEGRSSNQRAYAIANALVRDLLRVHGQAATGRVLSLVGQGHSFENAFEAATGESLQAAVNRFWRGQRVWERWIPYLTQPAFLWMAITLLALLAIRTHRQRRHEQRRRWEEEELADADRERGERLAESTPEPPHGSYDVH